MRPLRSIRTYAAVGTAALLLMPCAVSLAFADSGGKPLILDTQSGINDGQSGIVLQTAPLSRQPMVEAQPAAAPAEMAPNSQVPLIVAPYINLPTGGASAPQPVYRPRPSK